MDAFLQVNGATLLQMFQRLLAKLENMLGVRGYWEPLKNL
jgi:hypothetical protein